MKTRIYAAPAVKGLRLSATPDILCSQQARRVMLSQHPRLDHMLRSPSKHKKLNQYWASVVDAEPALFQRLVFAGHSTQRESNGFVLSLHTDVMLCVLTTSDSF